MEGGNTLIETCKIPVLVRHLSKKAVSGCFCNWASGTHNAYIICIMRPVHASLVVTKHCTNQKNMQCSRLHCTVLIKPWQE